MLGHHEDMLSELSIACMGYKISRLSYPNWHHPDVLKQVSIGAIPARTKYPVQLVSYVLEENLLQQSEEQLDFCNHFICPNYFFIRDNVEIIPK